MNQWQEDGAGEVLPRTHEKLGAREFRYDSPRARYLSRAVDPDTFAPPEGANQYAAGDWSDYDGDVAYGDFGLTIVSDDPVVTEAMRYLPGVGRQSAVGQSPTVWHHLGDLIGSTLAVTSDQGASETVRYTAFGEPAAGASDFSGSAEQPWETAETRYAYAGAHGYESGLLVLAGAPGTSPLTFQHLGARWYQPEIGRFVQRDPIGLGGGMNAYLYLESNPSSSVDPYGLRKWTTAVDWRVVWVGGEYVRNPDTGVLEYSDIYQTQILFVTVEDQSDFANDLGFASLQMGALALLGGLAGGPAGLVVAGSCLSLGLGAGGVAVGSTPPTITREWKDLDAPWKRRDPGMDMRQ